MNLPAFLNQIDDLTSSSDYNQLSSFLLIDFRVNGMIAVQKRSYYAECVGFLAAYGEAEEFLGKKNAKRDLLESWCSGYPRRSTFTVSLKSYL